MRRNFPGRHETPDLERGHDEAEHEASTTVGQLMNASRSMGPSLDARRAAQGRMQVGSLFNSPPPSDIPTSPRPLPRHPPTPWSYSLPPTTAPTPPTQWDLLRGLWPDSRHTSVHPVVVTGELPIAVAQNAFLQRRSLFQIRRRPPTIQDLCSPVSPSGSKPATRKSHRRQCATSNCLKYALTGGYCIRHGGGKLCAHSGCTTIAQSGGLCKSHGGGSRCKMPGCTSVARYRGLCQPHGGRDSCRAPGCTKSAHGGGMCISHGGGRRWAHESCVRGAQAGGYYYSHGGGKRCAAPECFRAARKGGRCVTHEVYA